MCCCVHSSSASNKSLIYWSTFMAAAQSKVLDVHRVIFWTGLFASRDFDLRNDAAAFRNQFYMPDDRYLGFHCSNEITVTDLGSSVEDFLLAVVTLRASLTTFGPFGKQRRFTVSVPYAQITRKLRYRYCAASLLKAFLTASRAQRYAAEVGHRYPLDVPA